MLGKYLGKIRNQINNWDCNRTHLIAPSEEHTSYFSFVLHRATLCGPHSFSPKYSPKKSYKKMPKEEKYVLFHVQIGNFYTLEKKVYTGTAVVPVTNMRWPGVLSWKTFEVFDVYFLENLSFKKPKKNFFNTVWCIKSDQKWICNISRPFLGLFKIRLLSQDRVT